jgi:hypothetical protein
MARVVWLLWLALAVACEGANDAAERPANELAAPDEAVGAAEPTRANQAQPNNALNEATEERVAGATPSPAPPPPAADPDAEGAMSGLSLSREQARAVLSSIDALAAYAPSFEPFAQSEIDAALRRGERSRESISAWSFAPALAVWRPAPDAAFQVLSGRVADGRALLAVVRASAAGYEHVASTTLDERDVTLAIGYRDAAPSELLFTSCYGCPGESGTLRYDPDQNVTLEFR